MGSPLHENPERRLDSWKEIASFLSRDERTVRRWEKEHALPVHRIPGGAKGRVFAYESELREWLSTSRPEEQSAPAQATQLGAAPLSGVGPVRKWVAALALVTALVGAILAYRSAHRFAVQASISPT